VHLYLSLIKYPRWISIYVAPY